MTDWKKLYEAQLQLTQSAIERADRAQRLAQPEQNVSYAGNGTASKENTTAPAGFFFQVSHPKPEECYSCGSIHSAYVRHCAKCGYMKGLENPEWIKSKEKNNG